MKTIEQQKAEDVIIKCRNYIQGAYNNYARDEMALLDEIDSLNICDHDYQPSYFDDRLVCTICSKEKPRY